MGLTKISDVVDLVRCDIIWLFLNLGRRKVSEQLVVLLGIGVFDKGDSSTSHEAVSECCT